MGRIMTIHKNSLTMNILYDDSKFQQKLQLYSITQSHAISITLNV